MDIQLKENDCKCHSETCCCDPYKIYINDEFICSGNDKDKMNYLVVLARTGLFYLQKENEDYGRYYSWINLLKKL